MSSKEPLKFLHLGNLYLLFESLNILYTKTFLIITLSVSKVFSTIVKTLHFEIYPCMFANSHFIILLKLLNYIGSKLEEERRLAWLDKFL